MYYVYVLKSINFERKYVGFTSNFKNRLEQHNSGKTKSTRPYKPWKILFYEEFDDKIDAIKREKYLKSGVGREYIKTRLRSSIEYRACPAVSADRYDRQGALHYEVQFFKIVKCITYMF